MSASPNRFISSGLLAVSPWWMLIPGSARHVGVGDDVEFDRRAVPTKSADRVDEDVAALAEEVTADEQHSYRAVVGPS